MRCPLDRELSSYLKMYGHATALERIYIKDIEKSPETENLTVVEQFLTPDCTTEAKLHFSLMIALELDEFLTLFQKNAPMFPFLQQEVFLILKRICSKFIKPSVMDKITSGTQLSSLDFIEIEFEAKSSLKKIAKCFF